MLRNCLGIITVVREKKAIYTFALQRRLGPTSPGIYGIDLFRQYGFSVTFALGKARRPYQTALSEAAGR